MDRLRVQLFAHGHARTRPDELPCGAKLLSMFLNYWSLLWCVLVHEALRLKYWSPLFELLKSFFFDHVMKLSSISYFYQKLQSNDICFNKCVELPIGYPSVMGTHWVWAWARFCASGHGYGQKLAPISMSGMRMGLLYPHYTRSIAILMRELQQRFRITASINYCSLITPIIQISVSSPHIYCIGN